MKGGTCKDPIKMLRFEIDNFELNSLVPLCVVYVYAYEIIVTV